MSLPNGWKKIKLGEICNKIGSGSTPKGGREVYLNAGIPIIRSQNVLNGFLDLNDVAFISDEQHSKMKGTWVHPNDILLNITGASIGRSCVVPATVKTANVNQHVCIIRLKECADACYVCNLILSKDVQKQIELLSVGGGRQGLNFQQIASFSFLLPPLEEQKKIAATLSVWDSAIEKMEKLIEANESIEQEWLKKFFDSDSVCKCLGDFFGKEIIVEKGQNILKSDARKGIIPIVGAGQSYTGFHDEYTHSIPTITISSSGAYAGYVWYHSEPIWASDCSVLYTNGIDLKYLFYFLKSKQNEIYKMQVGGAQPHVYAKDLKHLQIPFFELKKQIEIINFFESFDRELSLLKQQLENYKKQKQGLMQKLLTGQWRVK